jgi:Sodium/hydrogen exchanger family
VIHRLAVPHRIVSILEGESLLNDATALVALQFAVAALMTGKFSLGHASLRFVWAAAGGIGFGLLVGLAIRWVHRRLDDPPVQITISLLTPFLAYLSAERLHASGVLAVVAAGIYLGWHSPLIAYRELASGERCGGADPDRVGFSRRVPTFSAEQESSPARDSSGVAKSSDHRLVRNARRRLPGGRICASLRLPGRQPVSRKRLHFASNVLCNFSDVGVPRLDAADCDPETLYQSR